MAALSGRNGNYNGKCDEPTSTYDNSGEVVVDATTTIAAAVTADNSQCLAWCTCDTDTKNNNYGDDDNGENKLSSTSRQNNNRATTVGGDDTASQNDTDTDVSSSGLDNGYRSGHNIIADTAGDRTCRNLHSSIDSISQSSSRVGGEVGVNDKRQLSDRRGYVLVIKITLLKVEKVIKLIQIRIDWSSESASIDVSHKSDTIASHNVQELP